MRSLATGVDEYRQEHGRFPVAGPGSVDASTISSQIRPYFQYWHDEILFDRWRSPLRYTSDGLHYEIRSLGSDRRQGDCPGKPTASGFISTTDSTCDTIIRDGEWIAGPS